MSMTNSQVRPSEPELIRSICSGEREAFYELVRPCERMIYATAISVVKNPADAEEVAQEAVLKAFSNFASFRSESKFSTWLVQITYNEAKMKLRKARSHLYDSIDDQQQSEEESIDRRTMLIGAGAAEFPWRSAGIKWFKYADGVPLGSCLTR